MTLSTHSAAITCHDAVGRAYGTERERKKLVREVGASPPIWRLDEAHCYRWAGCVELCVGGVRHSDGLAGERHQSHGERMASGIRGREGVVSRHLAQLLRHEVGGREVNGTYVTGRHVPEPIVQGDLNVERMIRNR